MKKVFSLLIAVFAVLGFSQQAFAQLPQTSTASNPIWYYIENGHSSDTPARQFINDSDGRWCQLITANGTDSINIVPLEANTKRNNQLWRVEVAETVDDVTYYNLINKAGGKMIVETPTTINNSARFNTSTTETPCKISISLVTNSEIYCIMQTLEGKASTLDAKGIYLVGLNNGFGWALSEATPYGGLPTADATTKLTANPRTWRFIPEADINKAYPVIATDNSDNNWYFIRNTGAANKYLTNAEGDGALIDKLPASDENLQLFKFVQYLKADTVYIISKAGNTYLGYDNTNKKMIFTSTPYKWCLRHNYNPVENKIQFSLRTSRQGNFLNGDVEAGSLTVLEKGKNAYNTSLAWAIEPKGSDTGIKTIDSETLKVYAVNGYIMVEGTDAPISVYTITGASVNAKARMLPGIYIVKAGNKATKVMVK